MRLIKPDPPGVLNFFLVSGEDHLLIQDQKGKQKSVAVAELPAYNRGAKGVVMSGGIQRVQVEPRDAHLVDPAGDQDSEGR
jgi:DNA gyrase/topoisomerase IV subunit A